MSWATIRDGVKTRLDTITGLVARDTAPDTVADKDFAVVLPDEPVIEPSGHNGKVAVNIRIAIRCSRATLEDAQAAVDDYIWPTGAKSIVAAVRGDRTLGGAVDDTRFVNVDGVGVVEATKGVAMQADVHLRALVTA